MVIERLHVHDFRNYEDVTLEPGEGLNIIVGDNAQGKTNLLEAIYFAATTKSFRASRDTEVIRAGAATASVTVHCCNGLGVSHEISLSISEGERKSARIDGARSARAVDVLGYLPTVFFSATDLQLVHGEPAVRRRFMNLAICQTNAAYCSDLVHYRRIHAQRNALLRRLRDDWTPSSGIEAWNSQLAAYGCRIIARRLEFARELDSLARQAHEALSGGTEELSLRYVPSPRVDRAEDAEGMVDLFLEALERIAHEELRRGTTLVGPQRDDIKLHLNGRDARVYASQGQQRTIVLSLKLAELHYLEARTGERPVLLLDDVMSDLDDIRRERLLRSVADRCQVFLTCTSLRAFPEDMLTRARVVHVSVGRIRTE